MGQESIVAGVRDLGQALAATLAPRGWQVIMVDGQLVLPTALPPPRWHELRLRGPAGMITLRKIAGSETSVAIVVFGNAGNELLAARDDLATALKAAG